MAETSTTASSAQKLADQYVQRVSEWDDRTSPEDWPEALLITGDELKEELLAFAQEASDLARKVEPSLEAMKAAVELEIKACIGRVTTRGIGELIDRVAEARVREAMGRVPALAALLVNEIDGLFSESEGVAGLHQNGDVAPWSELEPGGEYERLTSLDDLRAALAQGEAARG